MSAARLDYALSENQRFYPDKVYGAHVYTHHVCTHHVCRQKDTQLC